MREREGRAWDEEASKENEYLSFPYYLHCLHVKVKHTFEKRKVERCNDFSLKLTKQGKIQGLTEKYGRNWSFEERGAINHKTVSPILFTRSFSLQIGKPDASSFRRGDPGDLPAATPEVIYSSH